MEHSGTMFLANCQYMAKIQFWSIPPKVDLQVKVVQFSKGLRKNLVIFFVWHFSC